MDAVIQAKAYIELVASRYPVCCYNTISLNIFFGLSRQMIAIYFF